jgi:hypothetical protein
MCELYKKWGGLQVVHYVWEADFNRMVALPKVYHTLDDSGNPKRTQLVFP